MPIRCPYCSNEMALKGARPGRFNPRCPGCGEKFTLVIPEDPSVMPSVTKAASSDETLTPTVANALGIPAAAARAAKPAPPQQQAAAPAVSRVTETVAPQPAAAAPQPAAPAPEPSQNLTGRLGGYELYHKLGEGGMGAVYLARQVSLDRNVALKILSPTFARDPQFVARFTREAYAAAQLNHHNIVSIHDIGAERDLHYFSMEFVEGHTLAHTVRESGKLDAEQAAGFILQAARGLKFAHDHGMIHRDIKPENLLLNEQGIVKVADLGLVKREGRNETQITGVSHPATSAEQTQVNMSMGTPAYMPPEQATDAAHVDQRADIYSLGCTFYDLLTGRPPFQGRTALEVITKHQREQITPPEMIVQNIPRSLSEILLKMVAKRPDARYQSMGEVIKALEEFLGVSSAGPFTPQEEHVKILEFGAQRFNSSPWAKLRSNCILAFYALCALGVVLLILSSHPLWAAAMVGFAVLTTLFYQITIGLTQKTHLFAKVRQLMFGSSILDWIGWIAIGVLAVTLLVVFNWHWPWLGASVLALGVAVGFHFSFDRLLSNDRNTPLTQVEAMLKQMRLRGLEESAVRQFVCRYSGNHWEEFYEALFGYEAKIQARTLWGKGERGRERKRFAAWRDPIIRWIESKQRARREAKEAKLLAKIEARALAAKGVNEALAMKQARKNAQKIIDSAARIHELAAKRAAETAAPAPAAPTKVETAPPQPAADASTAPRKKTIDDEDEDFERVHLSWFQRRFGTPIDLLLGPHIRFVLAVIVLLGFAMWWQQNKGEAALRDATEVVTARRDIDITSTDVKQVAGQLTSAAKDVARGAQLAVEGTTTRQLDLPMVPDFVCRALTGWNAGLAGAILLLSVLFKERMLGLVMLLAAGVAMLGTWFTLPVIGQPQPWMAAVAATVLALFAMIFLRQPEY